ncbi:hypothetical protein CN692_12485 [Bacillus sp. AFS002410]|uniref:hypothetical protein n=1 Tax=Bacillus sp. AFS002410 TaxID=2033481 RepID=UPI000BEFFCF4|nr:hypothetical protein [Bacillus sp. AFS002410]PEJ57489.1 hypothetical protein CN692_12485 [Bacillus sp. AFS002410]
MSRHLTIVLTSIFTLFSCSTVSAQAAERVVMNSFPSEVWQENIYLIADRIDWKEYRNFDVQIGNEGALYHFPTWKSGKYGTKMFSEDLNKDRQDEIIISLDNFNDPIHLLQIRSDGQNEEYKEVPVESVPEAVKRLVEMEKKGDIVTITTKKKTYKVNLKSLGFKDTSSDDSVYTHVPVDYIVEKKKLIADAVVMISTDGGGAIGNLMLIYDWNGKKYEVQSVSFEKYNRKR